MAFTVTEIFSSIQGEGLHAGYPAVFLRFQGCNLWADPDVPSVTCPWCDTPQLHEGHAMDLQHIVYRCMGLKQAIGEKRNNDDVGLVITGGEPMMQLTEELLWPLSEIFTWIDVETNGTIEPKFDPERYLDHVYMSVSPKTRKVRCEPDWWKVLIPDKLDLLGFCEDQYPDAPVYVQPVDLPDEGDDDDDEVYQQNVDLCVQLVKERGYRLSLQLHKILDLP